MHIHFVPDRKRHTYDPDPRHGTVEIRYPSGRLDRFVHVSRRDFFSWQRSGYVSNKPWNVRLAEPEEHLSETIEMDGPTIRWDDSLGQITGIPTPGYDCEIREDDYLGQVTGIPSVGYEAKK